jgi:hypothetical protein
MTRTRHETTSDEGQVRMDDGDFDEELNRAARR